MPDLRPFETVPVHSPEIDARTLESCRLGDRDAFRALYEAYKDRVYSVALHFFHGNEAAAGDVTQQVFVKLITGIRQFRGDAGFSTWLYRLVVNACVDFDRASRGSRQFKSGTLVTDAAVLEGLPDPQSLEDEFARRQTARSVQTAVSSLPPTYRLAILLRHFEDLSYEEIAAALNCSTGTVASRLNRGHRLLARMLAPLGDGIGLGRASPDRKKP